MGCNSCANLDPSNKKSGSVDGYLYYCKKKKGYVNATSDSCDDYSSAYRNSFECNEIYRNSKDYCDNNTPVGTYIFILIILVVLGFILGVFK